ncbi:MAG: hypothetical protein ACKV2T_38850 [Kofleriaceae bacterium]
MSYVTEYGTSARSSRSDARPRAYTQITQVTALRDDAQPAFVHLDPTGQHVAIRDAEGLLVDARQRLGPGAFRSMAFLTEWGAILGRWEMRWDGKTLEGRDDHTEQVPKFPVAIAQGYQLAARWTRERWTSVGQQVGGFDVRTVVAIHSRVDDDNEWVTVLPGTGAAAIADDGRVVVGMEDGLVRVYAAHGDAGDSMRGASSRELSIGEAVHAVSAIGMGAVVLSERATATGVRFIDDTVVWSADVAFTAHQPAIDGGDGRVYIAGDGLAAIDRGAIAWSNPSVVPTRATAFADGTLAVCRGPGLQILARDGSIVQQLATSDGATIMTPPAIGPDGSIWFATPTHLCVTR